MRYGKSKEVEVLLVTSRGSGRWLPPKGCEMRGVPCHRCAELEALEEAGVRGVVRKTPLGTYALGARSSDSKSNPLVVLYPMAVQAVLKKWKERHERKRQWFSLSGAAYAVHEPDLQAIILSLDTNRKIAKMLQ